MKPLTPIQKAAAKLGTVRFPEETPLEKLAMIEFMDAGDFSTRPAYGIWLMAIKNGPKLPPIKPAIEVTPVFDRVRSLEEILGMTAGNAQTLE